MTRARERMKSPGIDSLRNLSSAICDRGILAEATATATGEPAPGHSITALLRMSPSRLESDVPAMKASIATGSTRVPPGKLPVPGGST